MLDISSLVKLVLKGRHGFVEGLTQLFQLVDTVLIDLSEQGTFALGRRSHFVELLLLLLALAALVDVVLGEEVRVALRVFLHLQFVPLFELTERVATIFAEVHLGEVYAVASE